MAFWASFWPEFAATMLGIVTGIPVGLWIEDASGAAKPRMPVRLANALALLQKSVQTNKTQLKPFHADSRPNLACLQHST